MTDTFRCGHLRTPENTKSSPSNPKGRCRQCLIEAVQARANGQEALPPEQRAWNAMVIMGSQQLLHAIEQYRARRDGVDPHKFTLGSCKLGNQKGIELR
ncbi:hypothetical protein GG804_25095 [Sphingomonas histidinilytica]|uniref:hypothetical protein n=1 Tax=Rhizorhabdus histidinilytica TaxID=439228 RepID=UPI001ADC6624|nr:hypothetical protein [Rhizorhabdus histidinilytica]MBO9380049.1 hypothetical protein [Rhizorhabdus histidinilytica]